MKNEILITHYYNNYRPKVFLTRLHAKDYHCYLMYTYNYDQELENFAQTFLKYLPYYVRNSDYFDSIDDDQDLDSQLETRSRSLRKNSKIIPHRTIASDGIYGELFLDFYLRIVNKYNAIITYANKRSFDSNNETTGPDNLVYYVDENNVINLCICEAKFLAGASAAHKGLIEDIVGTETKQGHITKEYLNNYIQFVVEKGCNILEKDRLIFKSFISSLNKMLDKGNDFISILIQHNIRVNFIFFAIFDSQKNTPDKLLEYYSDIYSQCNSSASALGINNYTIEVVFIPTRNKTMILKQEMEKSYE